MYSIMSTVLCQYCNKEFKVRGLTVHQRKCKNVPKTITYNHCLVNEDMFAYILSFLNNQTLCKLQKITGDRYPCDESLIKYTCGECDNDNPAIQEGLCTKCHSRRRGFKQLITKTEAKEWYAIKDFDGIPCDVRRHYILYDRADLDAYKVSLHGSKLVWLKEVTLRETRRKTRETNKTRKAKDVKMLLKTFPVAFQTYTQYVKAPTNKTELQLMADRYDELSKLLTNIGLALRNDSALCANYIVYGKNSANYVVDIVEEMNFLHKYTNYVTKARYNIERFKEEQFDYYPRDIYNQFIQSCRDDAKMDICISYLLENKSGHSLPKKWETCRMRLNEIIDAKLDPTEDPYNSYIYNGTY